MDITADGRPLSVRMRGPLLTSFEYATPDKVVATIQDAYPAIIDRVVSAICKDTADTFNKYALSLLLSLQLLLLLQYQDYLHQNHNKQNHHFDKDNLNKQTFQKKLKMNSFKNIPIRFNLLNYQMN